MSEKQILNIDIEKYTADNEWFDKPVRNILDWKIGR